MKREEIDAVCANKFPALLGIKTKSVTQDKIVAEMTVTESHMAPNGFLHAGSVVSLADTSCSNGCIANLPDGAVGFTTLELKSNHVGTARGGVIECIARPVHIGRTTQVWDAEVIDQEKQKTIAYFRCTQLILY